MNIANLLQRSARVYGDRPALWHGDTLLHDYRSLARRAASLAAYLHLRHQVGPGDRVLIYAQNTPEYLEALYAIYWAGAVPVPVNFKLHSKEVAYIVADAGPAAVLVSNGLAEAALTAGVPRPALLVFGSADYLQAVQHAPMLLQERQPDDLASLFYTSGTTGRPKGVMQTHRNLLAMTACYFTDVDDVCAEDAMVYAAPMSHGAGLYNYAHVLRGARHVVPVSGGFDPAELMTLAQSMGRLSLFAAPTMVRRLVQQVQLHGGKVDGIKTIVYGGGRCTLKISRKPWPPWVPAWCRSTVRARRP